VAASLAALGHWGTFIAAYRALSAPLSWSWKGHLTAVCYPYRSSSRMRAPCSRRYITAVTRFSS
jgi:hypothetical protein